MDIAKRDLLILSALRQNSRRTLTQMSKLTKVPISTLHEIIRAKEGWKFTVLTDFAQWGYTTKAQVLLKLRKEDKNAARGFLQAHILVNSLYKVNNGYDFMCEVICRNLNDLEDFLDAVDERFKIKGKEIHHIMEDVKREGFLSHPDIAQALGA